jgi:hypothetical protein
VSEAVPDNVVYINEYLERKTKPDVATIKQRLAQIGIDQLLLASEKNRLTEQLRRANEEQSD